MSSLFKYILVLSMWGISYAPFSFAAVDPTQVAAEYYFSRSDYKQALVLWNQILERHPESGQALNRVCELRVMLEGKAACRDLAKSYLLARMPRLTLETRRQFRAKVSDLMQMFVAEDAQSAYFQGLARVSRNECPIAVNFFDRALRSDRENTRVLRDKAACEKKMKQWDIYLETLKAHYEVNPWDGELIESLGEAYVYFNQYEKAVRVFKTPSDRALSLSAKLALALAHVELGAREEAAVALEYIPNPPPIYWYLHSKLVGAKRSQDGILYQKKFVAAFKEAATEEWDPLRTQERVTEVKKALGIPRSP